MSAGCQTLFSRNQNIKKSPITEEKQLESTRNVGKSKGRKGKNGISARLVSKRTGNFSE